MHDAVPDAAHDAAHDAVHNGDAPVFPRSRSLDAAGRPLPMLCMCRVWAAAELPCSPLGLCHGPRDHGLCSAAQLSLAATWTQLGGNRCHPKIKPSTCADRLRWQVLVRLRSGAAGSGQRTLQHRDNPPSRRLGPWCSLSIFFLFLFQTSTYPSLSRSLCLFTCSIAGQIEGASSCGTRGIRQFLRGMKCAW